MTRTELPYHTLSDKRLLHTYIWLSTSILFGQKVSVGQCLRIFLVLILVLVLSVRHWTRAWRRDSRVDRELLERFHGGLCGT